jgi:hypothetical protein
MAGRKLWALLAGLWFIVYGLLVVSNLTITGINIVMAFLAILVGILLLFDR